MSETLATQKQIDHGKRFGITIPSTTTKRIAQLLLQQALRETLARYRQEATNLGFVPGCKIRNVGSSREEIFSKLVDTRSSAGIHMSIKGKKGQFLLRDAMGKWYWEVVR